MPLTLRLWLFAALSGLLLLLVRHPAVAQGENNNWYFGLRAGLTFNTTPPSVLTNGRLNTGEGCSTVSDSAGNLLFYTDGLTVWNRIHQPMPNGIDLMGNISSVNSAVVIRQPGWRSRYFVFTTDDFSGPNGLRYSRVDMSADSGRGDLDVKNVLLRPNPTEKLAWVVHPSGIAIWLIGHDDDSDVYFAYLIDATGISATPVTTAIGAVISGSDGISQLQVSPDGTRVATCLHEAPSVELLDFDAATGRFANRRILAVPDAPLFLYGLEFSGDGSKLYVGKFEPNTLYQFDLAAGSTAAINASLRRIGTTTATYMSGLQRGPDGKIYVALTFIPYLGVINYPDSVGAACGYVDQAIDLQGATCYFGLPTPVGLVNHAFQMVSASGCQHEPVPFAFTPVLPGVAAQWDFGDPASGAANTSVAAAPAHVYRTPGTYTATLRLSFGGPPVVLTTTVEVGAAPAASLPDTVRQCADAPAVLAAGGPVGTRYLWSTGDTTATLAVSAPGAYWVELTSAQGCRTRDTVQVLTIQPGPLLAPDTAVCFTEPFTLTPRVALEAVEWRPGGARATLPVTAPGTYHLSGMYRGCWLRDSIVVREQCPLFIPNIITPDGDGRNDAFVLRGLETSQLDLQVFNRWGALVFTERAYRRAWAAEGLAAGTYFYYLRDRTTGRHYKGFVEVVR